jgi:hypothetical protein
MSLCIVVLGCGDADIHAQSMMETRGKARSFETVL